jgi:hypothetical protein
MSVGDKVTKEFLNCFFNTLNELTTEMFVIFKELKNNYSQNILRRTKQIVGMIIDLYRILEIMTKWAPEIFLDKQQIHSIRLINYIMFVLHSIYVGKIDAFFEFFSAKLMHRQETLPQFLAPIIGILVNIYTAVNSSAAQQYDDLAQIFAKTDSFDPVLLHRLLQTVKGELPPVNA